MGCHCLLRVSQLEAINSKTSFRFSQLRHLCRFRWLPEIPAVSGHSPRSLGFSAVASAEASPVVPSFPDVKIQVQGSPCKWCVDRSEGP